ncbi:MAG: ADP-ribosylglycohydrolase family protein [Gemmatimonadaceae bacterium]
MRVYSHQEDVVQTAKGARSAFARPIENSYVIPGTLLAAGEYPGSAPHWPAAEAQAKLSRFSTLGSRPSSTSPTRRTNSRHTSPRCAPLAGQRGIEIIREAMPIYDMDICAEEHMRRVLDTIDAHLAAGRSVYVHCWGGMGRTGLVVGCWLVRHGRTGDAALTQVDALFRTMPKAALAENAQWGSPQTAAQRALVSAWATRDRAVADTQTRVHAGETARAAHGPSPRDRYLGAMLGLAVGDALGTTLEFRSPGSFRPIADIVGGGPFGLAPGQWTDDTSMALCLAESLLVRGGADAADQMRRFVRWIDEGHWSSTGVCFDVGTVVRYAIDAFRRTGNGFSGPTDENTAGNGSLMRLAPVPLFFAADAEVAIRMAADSSRTTHGASAAVDACRYFAGLLLGALQGVPKSALLEPRFTPVPGLWEREPLHPAVAAVADGSFRRKAPPEIRGGQGYVVDTLEAALWAFSTTDDFASGALGAVNLGGDADTTGAVYGQLAGAYYGVAGIPERWRSVVARGEAISRMAHQLYGAATIAASRGGPSD